MDEDEIKEEQEAYLRRRNFLIDVEREASRHFDKYVLTLAAGTFGLSLLFVERIAPHPKDGTEWLLIAAWVAFGVSILSTLISFLSGQESCSKEIEILDGKYRGDIKDEKEIKNKFVTWPKWLNRVSMFLFIVGVIFLITFSALNFLL